MIGKVPTGEMEEVATVKVTVPEELIAGGVNVAFAPDGKLDATKLTTPLNPAFAPTVIA